MISLETDLIHSIFMVKIVKTKTVNQQRLKLELLMFPYLIVTIALVLLGVKLYLQQQAFSESMSAQEYQAIFLTNGQVYFGHLSSINRSYFQLEDVYYVREEVAAQDELTEESNALPQSEFTVIRLGEEIHQPQNRMLINKDQILFWENLQADSRIVEAIGQDKERTQ